jgi:hypothetical protein
MNRRGFIGGLVGLTAGAVAVSTVEAKQVQSEPKPMRLRQILVDCPSSSWPSGEGEEVFIKLLQRNGVQVRKILRG